MEKDTNLDTPPIQINPGYALGQIAKALTTSEQHRDAEAQTRAKQRVAKWLNVFAGIVNGSLDAGSRTPLSGVPEWVTLEVVTGGFATGELLAGGAILGHESDLLSELSLPIEGPARQLLNGYFITEDGMARLRAMLASGRYEVGVPEEGALLVVAWLLEHGHAETARLLLDEIGPFFGKVRFYPIPSEQPRRLGPRIRLQDVAATIASLNKIAPNRNILAQQESIKIWMPLYDRAVILFLETVAGDHPELCSDGQGAMSVAGGWPCQNYPEGWIARARGLLEEFTEKRRLHVLCGKPGRKKENFAQLRMYLERCIENLGSLGGRDVGRIRRILAQYIVRRGAPESERCRKARERQAEQIKGPTHFEISQVVVARLAGHRRNDGIEDLNPVVQPVTREESVRFDVSAEAAVPESIQRKARRCLVDTADVLIKSGVITSAETLARLLPQVTAGIRAAGITDPQLGQLYTSIYRAFRRRRSLLLLNLESQIKIEELPWVAAIDRFRRDDLSARELAKRTLQEITTLTVLSFPHAIIPNKLLQEFRALAKSATLNLPLVDEVAADIFMGKFSPKFLEAAKRAAELLEGSLYESYFGTDYAAIRRLPEHQRRGGQRFEQTPSDQFALYCSARAGVSHGGWDASTNGMIIEQQQVLTTQNLAVLFLGLDLRMELGDHLINLAESCFRWICARQQQNAPSWHSTLIVLKNTAYAWRQMVFFLSMVSNEQLRAFISWADDHLAEQRSEFRARFSPALNGLRVAADGRSLDDNIDARRFLGWTKERHWLLGPDPGEPRVRR